MMRVLGFLRHQQLSSSTIAAKLVHPTLSSAMHTNTKHRGKEHLILTTSAERCFSVDQKRSNSYSNQISPMDYLKEIKHAPTPALVLGSAGLIPFVSLPFYLSMSGTFSPTVAFAQVAYGATILSFLGGVRWGFSVADKTSAEVTWQNLGYSVTPSLIAWVALLMPFKMCTFTVAGGLALAAYGDLTMAGYPAWFKGLRLMLTIVAVASLLLTLKHSLFLKENQQGKDKKVTNPNEA